VTLISFHINENTNVAGYAKPVALGGYLQSAEVHINLPPSVAADESEIRTVAVLVNEVGHVLGLGHTDLKQDIMYSAIDENAPNYGTPSTLDLEAVYKLLKHEADPNEAFQGATLWGIPNWVKRIPSGYELTIPGAEIITRISIGYPTAIFVTSQNQVRTFTIRVVNEGNVPIKIIFLKVILDGKDYFPTEDFPRITNPGSESELTWKIEELTQLSKFSADVEYEYLIPITVGWTTKNERIEGCISIVSEATTLKTTVTMPTQYVSITVKTETTETRFDYQFIVLLVAPVAIIGISLFT